MERPYIFLNFALSLDGKIGLSSKQASKFTSSADLERLLDIRERADAILVGRGTLEADQMSMTLPAEYSAKKQPLRCIVSRTGHFDLSHKVFTTEGGERHLLITQNDEPPSPALREHAQVHQTSLANFLTLLKTDLGVENLLCEGGGMLAKELFALDVIDEINLTIATHSLLGGINSPTITGLPGDFLPASRHYQLTELTPTKEDEFFLTYRKT